MSSSGVNYAYRVAQRVPRALLPPEPSKQSSVSSREYMNSTNLTLLRWQHWLYFSSLPCWGPRRDPTPLGPYGLVQQLKGQVPGALEGVSSSFGTWLPGCFSSSPIGWQRSCDPDGKLGVRSSFPFGWHAPFSAISLDSPLITGNVLYYFLK